MSLHSSFETSIAGEADCNVASSASGIKRMQEQERRIERCFGVSMAKTELEFREVRRFWYQIYCVLRGVLRERADHRCEELDDPLLGKGRLIMGRDATGRVTGTVMVTYANQCDLGSYRNFYELERLPARAESVAVVTKLMTAPDRRGTGLALTLLRAAMTTGLVDGITHAVYDANTPVDALFARMGGVDWLGLKRHPDFGDVRVMMTRLRDDALVFAAEGHPLAQCYESARRITEGGKHEFV